MYGRFVTIHLDETVEGKVWVPCTPDTPLDELERRAKRILAKKAVNAALYEAVEAV